ncbi:MAG: hypothetical protein PWQ57_2567 [Desulfovibrionales bacterium]|jgi:glutamate synthase domain-containing protein 3|nr:hypothetical protein [Desulfovibrionales bacterium]
MPKVTLDADGVYYRELNELVREAVRNGADEIEIFNILGQRYIAGGLAQEVKFLLHGIPGQDMGAFMRGPYVRVRGNAQDGVGNTMDSGAIVIEGMAGDVLGYGMRGGKVYVLGDVGYRVGIHMKAYKERLPVVVIGGKAGDFLGEYMAGGIVVLLGMNTSKPEAPITGRSLGTGMHGGVIYIRGSVPDYQLGPGLHAKPLSEADAEQLRGIVTDYAAELDQDVEEILAEPFVKVEPFSHRPYGNMYVAV